jgi:hypothetical protein
VRLMIAVTMTPCLLRRACWSLKRIRKWALETGPFLRTALRVRRCRKVLPDGEEASCSVASLLPESYHPAWR